MRGPLTLVLLLLQCSDLALTIRVPVVWNDDDASEVPNRQVETIPTTLQQQKIPVEYFEYTAKKPQFAVDIAAFHGVQSPENHYKSYPIRPFTGKYKPELGKHHMLDENKSIYYPYQQYVQKNEDSESINPTASSYEVFHPYKNEEPALQELYKDPILDKIRNDLIKSKENLQKYEKEAGQSDITKDEYLESPEETDRKKFPHKNIPAEYEIHRPLRRPAYYRPPPKLITREPVLNQKFRHPWNQHYVKVKPLHYRPLKNHLHNLRQHHSLKYDDEHNEYPQVPPPEKYAEVPDGYDIYLKGKDKYNQLRNSLDESINKAVLYNRPPTYQKLELQNNDSTNEDDDDEFVPIKSYAQVRKTETTKHLPKAAALEDAASYDDIVNAHRLREAVKSTKAQTVYSEEGYEDAAYDHAGEQKHASDHEAHGGFLKEKEMSGGKFKTPSLSGQHQDSTGSVYRDKLQHGKKWKNDDKDKELESDSEDYTDDDQEHSVEAEAYEDVPNSEETRPKRENESESEQVETETESYEEKPINYDDQKNISDIDEARFKRENSNITTDLEVNKTSLESEADRQRSNFKVPEINIESVFLPEDEIKRMSKIKIGSKRKSHLRSKYPYYFKNLESIHRDSPLRYAENLKLIPRKSDGGTEFYDSRSKLECSEVDEEIDPVPEKIKNNGTKTSSDDDDEETDKGDKDDFDNQKKKQRLKGLGDKIDCFRAKYFGKNPLDSPFFKEDIISNPEPILAPNLETYKLNNFKRPSVIVSENVRSITDNLKASTDFLPLTAKLRNETDDLHQSLVNANKELKSLLQPTDITALLQSTAVYSDIMKNIQNNIALPEVINTTNHLSNVNETNNNSNNIPYQHFVNKSDVMKLPIKVRRKRSTAFVYEPYKIIREGQVLDSKKTTTTSNISPLIKQLQLSRVVDKVMNNIQDKDQPVKRNVKTRMYKDISRKDREKNSMKESSESGFVDINVDKRRGEPRYEIKPSNHKSSYTPVEHKKAMSVEDYESQTNVSSRGTESNKRNYQKSKAKHNLQFERLPSSALEPAASKTIRRIVSTTTQSPRKETRRSSIRDKPVDSEESEEDYEEYDDEDEHTTSTTTSTTTTKPVFRRRTRTTTTTTEIPKDDYEEEEEEVTELPKLRLITRFREPKTTTSKPEVRQRKRTKPTEETEDYDLQAPKYREKKKQSTKSTLVTDTKKYGDGDDDMKKEEVDALIGVQQDMDEYMPDYEKESDSVMDKIKKGIPQSSEEDDNDYEEDEDDDDDDESDEIDADYKHDEINDNDRKLKNEEQNVIVTTAEPTKRTLVKTTEAPISTTEARSAKLEIKPIVSRKKIEIHKEIPVNTSAPHKTQFRQDIKEVEVIKELPRKVARRKPQKNVEVLELYKDDNLAKDINKLKDVEIFRENLDLKKSPRHGGNYRAEEIKSKRPQALRMKKDELETSQRKDTATVDSDHPLKDIQVKKLDRRLKSRKFVNRVKDSEASNAKLIELSDVTPSSPSLHGGNLKSIQDTLKSRNNNKSEKLIELDDEYEDDDDSGMHGGNFKSQDSSERGQGLHGGNYRNAKLIKEELPTETTLNTETESLQARSRNSKGRKNSAAELLNGFAKAVPILTTTPNYILDPSKRMYYYVDA